MEPRQSLADLIAAYPRDRIPAETARLYLDKLADLPAIHLDAAIHELICTTDRFPTVHAIRAAVAERLLQLPSEGEALRQLDSRSAWRRGSAQERPYVHPAVELALGLIGGIQALRTAENPSILRAQFLKLYREERGRALREVETGKVMALELVRPLPQVSCS